LGLVSESRVDLTSYIHLLDIVNVVIASVRAFKPKTYIMILAALYARVKKIWQNSFLIGLFSLIWFLLRTGTKPSRSVYPCQRAAAVNIHLWLTTSLIPFISASPQGSVKRDLRGKKIPIIAAVLVVIVAGSALMWGLQETRRKQREQLMGFTLEGRLAQVQPSSDIFTVQGTAGYDEGFKNLLNLMGEHGLSFYESDVKGKNQGPEGLIARDDVIIIKVNSQWDERGGTNTDLLRSIIEAIIDHPAGFIGEIVVADNGQDQYGASGNGGSLDWKNNNAEDRSQSVQKVVDLFSGSHKVSTYLWDEITTKSVGEYSEGDMEDGYMVNPTADPVTGIKVSYPKFKTEFGAYVSFKRGIWEPETGSYDSERLKVLNVPVLKTHFIYGVTACVKHYMGVVSDKLVGHGAHRSVGSGGMGTEMAETRMPTLNILDAIWINAIPERGPGTSYSEATIANVIMASTDPAALDYWAAKHLLTQVAQSRGFTDLSSIDPDNTASGSFGEWLRLSMHEIEKTGFQTTIDEDRMNIYTTNLAG